MRHKKSPCAALMLLTCLFAVHGFAQAQASLDRIDALDAELRDLDGRNDLTESKLAIDRYLSGDRDINAIRAELARLTAMAWLSVPVGAPATERMNALLAFLHEPGPWNESRPFSYDLDDPLGKNIDNKLLSTYLRTRRGNCVSMPALLVILGQRLGLRTTLALAPFHMLVKFKDEYGVWRNVEATAGGYKSDASYRRDMYISDRAMETRIYLRPLSPRETTAVLLSTAMEARHMQYDEAVALADLALKRYPDYIDAMLHKASAFGRRNVEFVENAYPGLRNVPPDVAAEYMRTSHLNHALFAQAEALGWREMTQEQKARYLKDIQTIKEHRK